jgi:hypothetical protein
MNGAPGPTAPWLIAPVAFLVILVVGLQALRAADERPPDPDLLVAAEDLPLLTGDVIRCERERPDNEPAQREVERIVTGTRVSSATVVACPQAFDGRRVTYVGEVVGDVLVRDGGAWAQVNDDAYALAAGPLPAHDDLQGTNSGLHVWLPDTLRADLEPGRPGRRGDVVEVAGVLVRADPEDAGGMTLRADQLRVRAEAVDVEVPVDPAQVALAAVACAVAAGIWGLRRREQD